MQIVVLANERQRQELSGGCSLENVIWIEHESEFMVNRSADAFIDLQFTNNTDRKLLLDKLLPKPVIINSVVATLSEINSLFIRINGWNTFLASPNIEAACIEERLKEKAESVFKLFDKKIEWVADEPGFITAKVASLIISEASLALQEGISTRSEIDTAMKLGTAYPYGPFQWMDEIGEKNVRLLLSAL